MFLFNLYIMWNFF